ncbi:MAG: type II toxin-antitoxin system Phd/YefM family antitoxin [Rhizomicrobium sp.]|jgi:prevent-host-death family protein
MATWATQDAKAKFAELLRAAEKAPQTIAHRGEERAVLLSVNEYRRLKGARKPSNFVEFMQASPLRGVDLKIERSRDAGRKVEL